MQKFVKMESKLKRVLSSNTMYPDKSEKLPSTGLIQLPERYEKICQISNGSFTSVFCVRDRGKLGPIYAAKYMKDKIEHDNAEVNILKKLQNCQQVPKIIEVCHKRYQTILITEYFAGTCLTEMLM